MSKFAQRLIITVTLGPLALFLIYLGDYYYAIPIAAVLALAAYEFIKLTHNLGWRTSTVIFVPLVVLFFMNGQWPELNLTNPTILISMLVVLAYALWLYELKKDKTAAGAWMAMTAGLFLLGWLGSHFFLLRNIEQNAWQWTMLAMLSTWMADSAAYVVGRFMAGRILGKHYLSPRLSPNKTIEGYVGGIVLGTGATVLIAYFMQLPIEIAIILGLLISIISPMGDLGISLLKREAGVKDSGKIFKEHGGALDRVDSLLWSITMAYYIVLIFT